MDTLTYEPAPEPDRTPRPNPLFAEPATPAACARDYESATSVRATMSKQERTR
ncbi:hypothetical protein ABZ621_36630 [Streptomyces sp. NPDC007863]|uniref:hypothetical protein n=1 Tax=Streptomyces sp. NPDC007863 TaxID=3154894 RepID=UPI0033E55F35